MFIFIGGFLYSLDPPNAYLWGGPDPPDPPPGIDAPAGRPRLPVVIYNTRFCDVTKLRNAGLPMARSQTD